MAQLVTTSVERQRQGLERLSQLNQHKAEISDALSATRWVASQIYAMSQYEPWRLNLDCLRSAAYSYYSADVAHGIETEPLHNLSNIARERFDAYMLVRLPPEVFQELLNSAKQIMADIQVFEHRMNVTAINLERCDGLLSKAYRLLGFLEANQYRSRIDFLRQELKAIRRIVALDDLEQDVAEILHDLHQTADYATVS